LTEPGGGRSWFGVETPPDRDLDCLGTQHRCRCVSSDVDDNVAIVAFEMLLRETVAIATWRLNMADQTTTTERIWSDFLSLPRASRDQFLALLVADDAIRQEIEDLLDLAIVDERRHEPTRSLDDVLAELGK
jgi:hypothetical protein